MRYIVVGSGIAGVTAAKTLREHDSDAKINIFSDEIHPLGLYDRKDMARRLPDGIGSEEDFLLMGAQALAQMNIEIKYEEVVRAFPRRQQVLLDHAIRMDYDRLLIACGSTPMLVDAPGTHLIGVHQLGIYEDIALIESWIPQLQEIGAAIIGHELLGLEMAYALRQRGVPTTLIVEEGHLAAPYLPEAAARWLEQRLTAADVTLIFNQQVTAYVSQDEKMLDAVQLADGREIATRMALSTIGVRPTTDWLEDSGLELDEDSAGIIVNDRLQTNFDHTFAAGSCAQLNGRLMNNWEQAEAQGRAAALNMLGQETTYVPNIIGDLDTKLFDLPFAYFGDIHAEGGEMWQITPSSDLFAQVRLQDGVITGAVLIGGTTANAATLHERHQAETTTTKADLETLLANTAQA